MSSSEVVDTIGKIPTVGLPAPQFSGSAVLKDLIEETSSKQFKGKYVILLFYSQDFLPQCPTELRAFSAAVPDFRKLNCEIVGISTDSVFVHLAWTNLPPENGGLGEIEFPLLGDKNYEISKSYGILKNNGLNMQATFIIDEKGILRHVTVNDQYLVRTVQETKRVVEELQKIDKEEKIRASVRSESGGDKKMEQSGGDKKIESSGGDKKMEQGAKGKVKESGVKRESKGEQKQQTINNGNVAKSCKPPMAKESKQQCKPSRFNVKSTPAAYDLKMISSSGVPKHLENGLKVTIDRSNPSAGDTINVTTGDTVRAVLVRKKGSPAEVLKSDKCECKCEMNKEVIHLGKFKLTIEHSETNSGENRVRINDFCLITQIKGNRCYVTVEMNSAINHFVNMFGQCLFFKSEKGGSAEDADYVAVENEGKVVTLRKNVSEH